ncbi:MAG: LysR family transcriptional regulator [Thermoguttaceae bacterium]|jgi:DNA-binding transcriptional LysR family regulator
MPRPTNLPVELLQTFLLLIECGGDAAQTADTLGINQPSMSKRLRRLQCPGKALKHPWVFRDGKTWIATEEGQRVLPAVRNLMSRYEQLRTFAGNGEVERAVVRFACGRQAVARFVHRAARQYWAEHPEVQLRVSTLPGTARIEGVANGVIDLATVAHDELRIRKIARRDLHVETIYRDRLALVCRRNTRWAAAMERLPKHKVGPSGFVGFPLLLPGAESGVRVMLDDVLRTSGVLEKLDIRLEVSSWTVILGYVSDRLGVGLVSESAVPKAPWLIVRYLDPALIPPYRAKLICRRAADCSHQLDLSHSARAFYRILKQTARQRWEL